MRTEYRHVKDCLGEEGEGMGRRGKAWGGGGKHGEEGEGYTQCTPAWSSHVTWGSGSCDNNNGKTSCSGQGSLKGGGGGGGGGGVWTMSHGCHGYRLL